MYEVEFLLTCCSKGCNMQQTHLNFTTVLFIYVSISHSGSEFLNFKINGYFF